MKTTPEQAEEYVNSRGLKLLTPYEYAFVELQVECKEGHVTRVNMTQLKARVHGCKECGDHLKEQNRQAYFRDKELKKKSFEDMVTGITEHLEEQYQLYIFNNALGTKMSYKPSKKNTPLLVAERIFNATTQGFTVLQYIKATASLVQCPEGHQFTGSIGGTVTCPVCKEESLVQRFEDQKAYVESQNYMFLVPDVDTFKVTPRLVVRCPNGHRYATTYANFKAHRCAHCHFALGRGGPGGYNQKTFDRNPELANSPGTLYFFKFKIITGEVAYKIGITKCWSNRKKSLPSKLELIYIDTDYTLYECWLKEQAYIAKYSEYSLVKNRIKYVDYYPFGGITECFINLPSCVFPATSPNK